ncbi:MAG: nucleotidyltransferase family protein, partial [Elusimicrobiaceae bacterium]|nr:nucleotidyltransferase family protein [Elusimicrobiaceae bacterium]
MKEFTAIIPAAGKGVRLLPYTENMPKTMISVAGKPILGHILDQVENCGIKKVAFIVGYKKEAIIEFVRKRYAHLEVTFIEQPEPKGLGHAIYLAKDYVTGPCFILLGDTIVDGDLRPLVFGGQNAVGIKEVQDPSRFGIVELKEGNIISFEEKPACPKSNLAIIGAYSFLDASQLFDALEEVIRSGKTVKNEIQLTDALSVLLSRGEKIVPVMMKDWFDCGTVEVLLQTNRLLLARHHHVPAELEKNNTIIPPCQIE